MLLIYMSSKQEVAKAENFLYEATYWPASALRAQEVPEYGLSVSACVCFPLSIASPLLPSQPLVC